MSSSGGVLLDLLALEPWWRKHKTTWAVVKAADTLSALHGQHVYWVKECAFERFWDIFFSFFKAFCILRKEKPDLIVSAGTGAAIAFYVLGKIFKITCFWIVTFNIIKEPGISSKICSRFADEILIQRRTLLKVFPKGVIIGELY